jgi:hypothetical protein
LAKDVVHRKRIADLRLAIETRHSRSKAMLHDIEAVGVFAFRVLRLGYRAVRSLWAAIGNTGGKRPYSSVTVFFPSGKSPGHSA